MIPREAANFKGERAQGGHGNTHGLIWINNESINGGLTAGTGKGKAKSNEPQVRQIVREVKKRQEATGSGQSHFQFRPVMQAVQRRRLQLITAARSFKK